MSVTDRRFNVRLVILHASIIGVIVLCAATALVALQTTLENADQRR